MENKIDYPNIRIKQPSLVKNEGNGLHFGQILEKAVRRSPVGISELARRLSVSRRSVYNWFESDKVNVEVIRKIGFIIGHDFSAEFPDEFAKANDYASNDPFPEQTGTTSKNSDAVYYWMDKYIKLLEKVNSALSIEAKIKIDAMMLFLITLVNSDLNYTGVIINNVG